MADDKDNRSPRRSAGRPSDAARKRFGLRLRRFQLERGWSQVELSRRSGISRDLINSYVNGHTWPNSGNAKRLADALEISLSSLLDDGAIAGMEFPMSLTMLPDGRAHLRIDAVLPFTLAVEAVKLLGGADLEVPTRKAIEPSEGSGEQEDG